MSINLTINGVSFPYPETGDQNWGAGATNWASAVTSGMLSKAGGSFSLTAEADFGTNFGLKALYLLTETANPSGTGFLRLANADGIGWRNTGNSADLILKPDANGILQYNSIDLVNLSSTQSLSNKTLVSPVITGSLSITNLTLAGTLSVAGTSTLTGNVGIGGAPSSGTGLTMQGTLGSGSGSLNGYLGLATYNTTGTVKSFNSSPTYTTSTAANAINFYAEQPIFTSGGAATNTYGFYSNVSSGANSYAFYSPTAAQSSLGGALAVTGQITGNLTGNVTGNVSGTAATFTGNLTGNVTSVGMSTTIAAGVVTNAMLAGSIAYSKLVLTGAILNADLAGSIADTKLLTISTAGKVSDSALPSSMATKTFTGVTTFPGSSSIDGSGNAAFGTLIASPASAARAALFNSVNANGVYVEFQNSSGNLADIGSSKELFTGGALGDFGIGAASTANLQFGSGLVPAITITANTTGVVFAGAMRLNGANVANGAVLSVFTPASGPTGAATAIQGWLKINVSGTDHYVPYW